MKVAPDKIFPSTNIMSCPADQQKKLDELRGKYNSSTGNMGPAAQAKSTPAAHHISSHAPHVNWYAGHAPSGNVSTPNLHFGQQQANLHFGQQQAAYGPSQNLHMQMHPSPYGAGCVWPHYQSGRINGQPHHSHPKGSAGPRSQWTSERQLQVSRFSF